MFAFYWLANTSLSFGREASVEFPFRWHTRQRIRRSAPHIRHARNKTLKVIVRPVFVRRMLAARNFISRRGDRPNTSPASRAAQPSREGNNYF